MVAFFFKNPINLSETLWVHNQIRSCSDASEKNLTLRQIFEKERVCHIYHRDAHYYVIISHNSSVPMIGHLELATGTLMSHASWAWLIKSVREVRFFSDASEQILIWLWTQGVSLGLISFLKMNATDINNIILTRTAQLTPLRTHFVPSQIVSRVKPVDAKPNSNRTMANRPIAMPSSRNITWMFCSLQYEQLTYIHKYTHTYINEFIAHNTVEQSLNQRRGQLLGGRA